MSLVPMNTPTGTSFFDPKQEAEVKRRRRMAQAMMKAGEQPTSTEMVSGMAVKQSPWAALARAVQSGIGSYQEGKADTAEADIAKRRQEMIAQAISAAQKDPSAAASILAQDPSTADSAISMVNASIADDRAMRRQQAMLDAAFPQRQQELALGQQRLESGQFELSQARRAQQMQDEILRQMQNQQQPQQIGGVIRPDVQELNSQMQGMSGASPATTQDAPANPEQMRMAIARMAVVNPAAANAMRAAMMPSTGGATGMIADRLIEQGVDPLQALLIAKSGIGSGNTMQGGQVQPMPGMTETLQARNTAEALGTARGTSQGNTDKNAMNATTADALIEEAKTLVQQASGSYPGAISTAIQSGLGRSTPESQANASLEALSGRLISMMPRMEGPQSDRDVQLYTQMAGSIASPTVPMGDKLAALNTIQNINKHYQGMASNAIAAAPQDVQPRARRRFNPATGELE